MKKFIFTYSYNTFSSNFSLALKAIEKYGFILDKAMEIFVSNCVSKSNPDERVSEAVGKTVVIKNKNRTMVVTDIISLEQELQKILNQGIKIYSFTEPAHL